MIKYLASFFISLSFFLCLTSTSYAAAAVRVDASTISGIRVSWNTSPAVEDLPNKWGYEGRIYDGSDQVDRIRAQSSNSGLFTNNIQPGKTYGIRVFGCEIEDPADPNNPTCNIDLGPDYEIITTTPGGLPAGTAPDPPDGLNVISRKDVSAKIGWKPSAGADHYQVYYYTPNTPPASYQSLPNVSGFLSEAEITGLRPETTYWVHMNACYRTDCSGPTTQVTLKTLKTGEAEKPGSGAGLTAGTGEINLKIIQDILSGGSPVKTGGANAIKSNKLGDIVSAFLNLFFLMAGFLLLIWLTWGVFQYIIAEGEKEKLARARSRITWAFVGFLIVIAAFGLSRYAKDFFLKRPNQSVINVSVPPPPP